MFLGFLYTPLSTSSLPSSLFTKSKNITPFLQNLGKSNTFTELGQINDTSSSHLSSLDLVA